LLPKTLTTRLQSWRQRLSAFGLVTPLAILALHFLLYSLARLAMLAVHIDTFRNLTLSELFWAFTHGLRFDASMVFLLWGLPLSFMLMPLSIFRNRTYRGVVLGLVGVSLVFQAFLFLVDNVYFSYVHRHIGMEALAVFSDLNLLGAMVLEDYLMHAIVFLVLAIAFAWMYWRLISRWLRDLPHGTSGWTTVLIFMLISAAAIRGGVSNRKSVNIVHAFEGPKLESGYLTLNASFSIYHSLRSSYWVSTEFMDSAEALQTVRESLNIDPRTLMDPEYPLCRSEIVAIQQNQPNVVVIMLESWDAWFIDAWRATQDLPALELTPNFDALATEGRLFTDFYAAGQRSVHGVAAILASIPTLPGVPYIGTGGLEQNRLCFLSGLAKAEGYHTFFLRSARRESYRLDRVAQVGSFDLFRGSEDLAERHKGAKTHNFGVWDEIMFADAADHITGLQEPFFGFLFPSSTHHPFSVPDPKWQISAGDSRRARYENSLRYSDHTLGEFFRQIRDLPSYQNTIFVITADHVSGVRDGDLSMPERFRVPCLILGPGIEAGVDDRTSSQLDILPTINRLAGWKAVHSSLGIPMMRGDPGQIPSATMSTEHEVLRKEGGQWLMHNLDRRLLSFGEQGLDEIEKRLLATVQVVHFLLSENRVYPGH
jgi:phosphoglycerol transferase MdoB-like AlkP superfamily enzyme